MPVYQPPPPSAQQPPVQMPFSDPFHNRDPFMPGAQHRRKDSYGAAPPLLGPIAGPAAHPSHNYPPVYHNDHGRSPFEDGRRRSVGGASSPSRYVGGPLEPPPPPSFASRNMPPPSPSSISAASFGPHTSRPPPPSSSPSGAGREPPSYPARSGGMSIGSLIGDDRSPSGPRSPRAMTTQNSPTFRSQPLSPKRARSTSMRDDYRRADDRERERDRAFLTRPLGGGQPYAGPASTPAFRPYQSSPTSAPGPSPPTNGHPAPPRPNSQPTTSVQQERSEVWPPAEPRVPGAFREYAARPSEPPRHYAHEEHRGEPSRSVDAHASGTVPFPLFSRRDDAGRHDYGHHNIPPETDERRLVPSGPATGPESSPAWREHGVYESRFRPYGNQGHSREVDHRAAQDQGRREDDAQPPPRSHLTVSPELNRKGGRSSPLPQAVQGAQPRLMGPGRDPSIKNEFGRMFSGLGSGVGGSNTPVGQYTAMGSLTPSRTSPSRYADGDLYHHNGEGENIVDGHSILHRHDRPDEAGDGFERANGTATPAEARDNKRVKTGPAPHHHRHHGHAHTHRHHHHHHHHLPATTDDRSGFSTIRFPTQGNGSAPQATPSGAHHHHHHHHHHGRHVHIDEAARRRRNPMSSHSAATSGIVVNQQREFDEAMTKPKGHLGSALYQNMISMPPQKLAMNDTVDLFSSVSKSIPRFEGKEYCTFTVRVPREYVSSLSDHGESGILGGGLDQICKRRAVWGSFTYTDDSDVVAAAIHSGWLQGDFGEYNSDISSLFPPEEPSRDRVLLSKQPPPTQPPDSIVSRPEIPYAIPPGKDLHITVLILPPLEKYTSMLMNNMRSRSWGNDHEGMSYAIYQIKFVDEPRLSRFAERGSHARKAKLTEELRRREAAEGLLGMGRGVGVGA